MPATDLKYSLDRPHQQRDCLITYRSRVSCVAIFGHIARLSEEVPAFQALRAQSTYHLVVCLVGTGSAVLVDQTTDGSIRFVTTPSTYLRRYGDQPFSLAMAQE